MRTPKEYTENLKKGIITSKMLEDALYSVNKRAKNYRDAARISREYTSRHCRYDGNDLKKEEMYKYKEELLKIVKPICIHKEFHGYKKTRVYDYQKNYERLRFEKFLEGTIVWENCYYSGGWDDDWNQDVTWFFDYEDPKQPIYQYYLYHVVGEHSFHSLIDNPNGYKLPIVEIGQIVTKGDEIEDLLSLQFVKKMLELIKTKNYEYVVNTENVMKEYDNNTTKKTFSPPTWDEIWEEFIKNDLLEFAEEKERKDNTTPFSLEEIKEIHSLNHRESFRFRNKEAPKKIRMKLILPRFSRKKAKHLLDGIPTLMEKDKEYLKNSYEKGMSKNAFVKLLFETETVNKFARSRLFSECRKNRLVDELNDMSEFICRSKRTDIEAEEVIEKFLQEQQNS